jgi:hypothetical protein
VLRGSECCDGENADAGEEVVAKAALGLVRVHGLSRVVRLEAVTCLACFAFLVLARCHGFLQSWRAIALLNFTVHEQPPPNEVRRRG